MSKAIQDVLPTALALTTVERAELAAELLASLDGEPEAGVEAAWAAEIERRARRVVSGDAKGRPWSEVYAGRSQRSHLPVLGSSRRIFAGSGAH